MLCREFDIDLIHTHDAASQFGAALMRLSRPSTKLLMTFHRSLAFESARQRDRIRNAFACALSGAVVTASVERLRHFRSENTVSKRKLKVIPLGIDTRAFCHDPKKCAEIRSKLNIRPETVVVGAVGHFGREKGIDVAISAFGEMCQRSPELDSILVVLGDGSPDQRRLITALVAEQPHAKVILSGFQSNVRDWYSAFDVFLHTPRLEAFGLVVIEAMAASLPVVATRVGGVPELVRHEQTGLLCDSDSPIAVANALTRLTRDPQLRDRFGTRSVEVANTDFCATLAGERYVDLYRQLLFGHQTQLEPGIEWRRSDRDEPTVSLSPQEAIQ